MKRHLSSVLGRHLGLALCAALFASAPVAAEESVGKAKTKAAPAAVRLNPEKLAGVGLPAEEPFMSPEEILSGTHKPRGEVLFMGEQLVMEVYEDEPATFAFNEPLPYDEYVQVLSGKLILTDASGQTKEFNAGDSLVLPKGFTGIWQMLGNYRELIAIERKAYDEAYGTVGQ